MTNAAVPHILLVDEKFHRLNRELKEFHRRSSSRKDWEAKRDEMRLHLEGFIRNVVSGVNITNYTLENLPLGRLDEINTLLYFYRRGKLEHNSGHGFQKFESDGGLKSRLVCYWCVKKWLKHSENVTDEEWRERTTRKFLHIFGTTGDSQSSELILNRQMYAGHSGAPYDVNGGSRCKGASATLWNGHHALAIVQENGTSLSCVDRILVQKVPDDRFYEAIFRELTSTEDHCYTPDNSAIYTNKFYTNYDGFIDISKVKYPHSLRQCLDYNTTRYESSNVVLLEGLVGLSKNGLDVMYLPRSFSGIHTFSYTESIDREQPLGLFLFVKSNLFHDDDPHFEHITANQASAALSAGLRWKLSGKLYRIRPELFQNLNQDGSTSSAIELADWLYSSPVLREIKGANPHLELPTIRTTLRTISIYSLTKPEQSDFKIQALKNHSRTSNHADAYLFKLNGFRLGSTNGSVKLVSVDDPGQPKWWADLSESDFSDGYLIVRLPRNLVYSTRMELNLIVSDDHGHSGVSVQFDKNTERRNHYDGEKNITVLKDKEELSEILSHHLKLKLSDAAFAGVPVSEVSERFFIDSQPVYSEILKELMSDKPHEFPLTTRESRLGRSLLGLDMLSFGRQNLEENSFGVRLRSMGLYRPVEGEEGKKHWRADGEHIVQLSKTWNLLLTNKSLHFYGLSVNDERLTVTNHGTFFKSDETINELSSIPREPKPRFLHHIAPNPQSHLQFLVDLMDCDPAAGDSSQYENLEVSHLLRPTDGGRLLGQPSLGRNASRYHLQHISSELNSVSETKRSFYLTHQAGDGPLTCFDLALARNQNGTEMALILRRHHQSGQIDTLNLGRWLDDGRGNMVPHRPAWWARLRELEQQQPHLKGLSETLGAQHETPNRVRSHDWHFMVRDTLRAFHLLSGQFPKPQINTLSELRRAYSYHWPEPLRKYLMGGGRYFGPPEQRNGDALGGLLDDLDELREPGLKRAIIGAVLRWTWCPRG